MSSYAGAICWHRQSPCRPRQSPTSHHLFHKSVGNERGAADHALLLCHYRHRLDWSGGASGMAVAGTATTPARTCYLFAAGGLSCHLVADPADGFSKAAMLVGSSRGGADIG